MLVLTRKRSEMIQIGENIVIKIIQTGKSSVKIGIEAPNNVRVLRSELEPHTGNEYLLQRLQDRHTRLPKDVVVEAVAVEATST